MAKSKADRIADEKRAAAAERMRKYRAAKNKKPATKKQVTRVTRASTLQPYQPSDRVQYGLNQVEQSAPPATTPCTQFERLNFAAQDVTMKLNIIDSLLVSIGERLFGGIAGEKSHGATPMPSGHYYQLNTELGNANEKASAIIDKLKGLSEFA